MQAEKFLRDAKMSLQEGFLSNPFTCLQHIVLQIQAESSNDFTRDGKASMVHSSLG